MSVFDQGVETAAAAWVWTVRDDTLTEYDGQIDGYLDVQCTPKDLDVGDWSLTLPIDHPDVDLLLTEGFGVVARLPGNQDVIASGYVDQQKTTYAGAEDDQPDTVTLTGALDVSLLAGEQCWPDPAKWLNDATSRNVLTGGVDARSGIAEDVLLAFIAANIGSSAFHSTSTTPHIDRRQSQLVIPSSSHRGSSGSYQGNFGSLLEMGQAICSGTAGITFDVLQGAAGFVDLLVRARADVSADVVFSRIEGSLDSAEYTRQSPTITRGIAVSDDGTNRSYAMAIDTAAEALWTRRWVSMTDGDSNVIADLLQAAGALVATGTEMAGAVLQPVVLPGAPVFGVDYMLGDTVTAVDRSGSSITDRLVQVAYQHTAGAAPTITPSIGVSGDDLQSALVPVIRAITARIRQLDRRPR